MYCVIVITYSIVFSSWKQCCWCQLLQQWAQTVLCIWHCCCPWILVVFSRHLKTTSRQSWSCSWQWPSWSSHHCSFTSVCDDKLHPPSLHVTVSLDPALPRCFVAAANRWWIDLRSSYSRHCSSRVLMLILRHLETTSEWSWSCSWKNGPAYITGIWYRGCVGCLSAATARRGLDIDREVLNVTCWKVSFSYWGP